SAGTGSSQRWLRSLGFLWLVQFSAGRQLPVEVAPTLAPLHFDGQLPTQQLAVGQHKRLGDLLGALLDHPCRLDQEVTIVVRLPRHFAHEAVVDRENDGEPPPQRLVMQLEARLEELMQVTQSRLD